MAGLNRDPELCTDTIGRGDQHRVGIARGLQVKKPAKAADPRHDTGAIGAFDRWFDPLHQVIARININARIGIGQRLFFGCHDMLPVLSQCHVVLVWGALYRIARGLQTAMAIALLDHGGLLGYETCVAGL